ncbi:LETM1 domain-containing protein mdm28, mitochondrial-like [Helianthus annuus]|nr:LETM1 domain-containing protein mdm28, mitochondrial-like [Helianthus annuus]
MNTVRRCASVSNDEIRGSIKLFNDELTLDNISRPQLVNMCKYNAIGLFGTYAYVRYMLRKRLQETLGCITTHGKAYIFIKVSIKIKNNTLKENGRMEVKL